MTTFGTFIFLQKKIEIWHNKLEKNNCFRFDLAESNSDTTSFDFLNITFFAKHKLFCTIRSNQILPPSEQLRNHFFKPPSVLFVSKFLWLFFLNINKKTIVMMSY